jgi:carbon monoxide dehydrogenase subunit G
MPRSEVTVSIARSPADVFAVLSDVENTHKWYPKPVTEKWTSEGPIGVGSTRRSEARAFGMRVENDAEVTIFDRDQALGLRSLSGAVPFDIVIRLTPTQGGTTVNWVTDLRPDGIYRAIVPLTMWAHTRASRQGLLNLKEMMESGAL